MTKEQVELHGDIIKWWLDNIDKGVYARHINGENWEYITNPSWSTNNVYVQNDEYAELRMAQADGKIIQHQIGSVDGLIWVDIECITKGIYRIKPDEPTFKVGDWIFINSKENDEKSLEQIKNIDEYGNKKCSNSWIGYKCKYINLELWQPKEGEWCVFFDEESEGFYVEPFSDEEDGLFYGKIRGESFANIAPLEFLDQFKGN